MLDSITYSDKLFNMPITTFLACIGAALALGIGTALIFQFKTKHTASMAITLAIMPPAIALVIMLVNGNIGAGLAVAGTFALVRFRSAPGTAKEITGLFMAVAIGLACGMGYVGVALIFFVLMSLYVLGLGAVRFGDNIAVLFEYAHGAADAGLGIAQIFSHVYGAHHGALPGQYVYCFQVHLA